MSKDPLVLILVWAWDARSQVRGKRTTRALAQEDVDDPVGGPGPFRNVMDERQRLELNGCGFRVVGERTAEVLPVAAHRQGCGADAAAEIEDEDL